MGIVNEALNLFRLINRDVSDYRACINTHPKWFIRGDGWRYKEPINIYFDTKDECSDAWSFLLSQPDIHLENNLVISDEFPSEPRSQFAYYKSYALIKRMYGINVVSKGRLGHGVWTLHSKLEKHKSIHMPKIQIHFG